MVSVQRFSCPALVQPRTVISTPGCTATVAAVFGIAAEDKVDDKGR